MATFSVTERGTFRRCRRQWYYSSASLLSLGSVAPQKALSLGKTIHAAMAQWLQEPNASLRDLFAHQAADERQKIEAAYRAKVGANISPEELTPFLEGVDLGLHMAANYQQKWQTPIFDGFTVVQPELNVNVPVPGTPHTLSARLDAIIQRTRTGELFILEHKTYSSRPRLPTLQMNDQFLAYQWAVQQLNIGHVAGVAYDGLWKREAPPRGSTFDDLFTRVVITRPQAEVAAFGAILAQELMDMSNLLDRIADAPRTGIPIDALVYPNRRWEGCYDCRAFEELCTLHSRGEDWQHARDTRFVHLDADKNAMDDDE